MITGMIFDFKRNKAWAAHLQIVMQLGLTMAGCIVFCFFIGLYLDRWLATKGIMVAVFTILGVIGGGITSYRQILDTLDSKRDHDNAS
ncbi:MAG: AtpZ/AtpI family protein [Desulfobacteraceae bacterium]|jgi:F0F1-type ATP synthase assembly protein I